MPMHGSGSAYTYRLLQKKENIWNSRDSPAVAIDGTPYAQDVMNFSNRPHA